VAIFRKGMFFDHSVLPTETQLMVDEQNSNEEIIEEIKIGKRFFLKIKKDQELLYLQL
jgi:hypothetical protein